MDLVRTASHSLGQPISPPLKVTGASSGLTDPRLLAIHLKGHVHATHPPTFVPTVFRSAAELSPLTDLLHLL